MRRSRITALALLAALPLFAARSSLRAEPAGAGPCVPCETLSNLKIADTNLLSAAVVPGTDSLPAHCRVLGYVRPAINFEIVLPLEEWNGKYLANGCGGYCGSVGDNAYGLGRYYVASSMDSGHWGESFFDGRWAYHDRVAEVDWAHRAVHETARVSKALIESFYGRTPDQSYFVGCSTGGRMAAMEASRYPDDFDGIVCGAPALDYTGLVAIFASWVVQANTDEAGMNIITRADLEMIHDAVLRACDDRDGLSDRIIADPRDCEFDPEAVLCRSRGAQDCLTKQQVRTLKAWYQGPRNSSGEQLYPGGLTLGSEDHWRWWHTGTSDEVTDDAYYLFARDFLRYMAFQDDPGESIDVADFDFDRDPPRLNHMAQIYNATVPDLQAYQERGGKLLIYHGWGDAGIPPGRTIEYYEMAEKQAGSRQAAQGFVRLFMIPGMGHCGGAGYEFDALSALERWVEDGKAPETLRVTKRDTDGNIQWMRDLFPYPLRTVYRGAGSPAEASSYGPGSP